MAATFLEMKTRIATAADRDVSTEGDDIGEAIVAAIKFYEKKAMWWFLETNTTSLSLTTATNTITLPSDFNKLIGFRVNIGSAWITDNHGMDIISYRDLKEIDRDPNLTGEPSNYALFGDTTIRVYPTANDTYSTDLDYYKKDATYPSSDGDTSVLMGDNSEDLIYYNASSRYWGDTLHDAEKRAEFAVLSKAEEKMINRANNSRQSQYSIL